MSRKSIQRILKNFSERSGIKKLFRYRYADEKSHFKLIWSAVVFTVIWFWTVTSQYHSYELQDRRAEWFGERFGLVIFVIIYWGIVILVIFRDEDRQYIENILKNGDKRDGEIVAYVPQIHYYRRQRGKKMKRVKTYTLCVKCGDEMIITPELRGNPERVLKSHQCKVYYINPIRKYVTDFDTRIFRIGKRISVTKITEENFNDFFGT